MINNPLIKNILLLISNGVIDINDIVKTRVELEQHAADLRKFGIELEQQGNKLDQRNSELDRYKSELDKSAADLAFRKLKYGALVGDVRPVTKNNYDRTPWQHPYLTGTNIKRFREYSEAIWQIALEHASKNTSPQRLAFVVNMNQNMYKWARLAREHGSQSALFLNPMDATMLNRPEWEEYDGDFADLAVDAQAFLAQHPQLSSQVPCFSIPMDGGPLINAVNAFFSNDRKPLARLLAASNGLRHEAFMAYAGFYPYFEWAKALTEFDAVYTTGPAFAAYASNIPYCVFSYGGDLMFEAGKGDEFGEAILLSNNAARFVCLSNPHTLAYSRRLGLTNSVYLPYPMDDSRYSPGQGEARKEWNQKHGEGVYVLMTSRIDVKYKGQDASFFQALVNAAKEKPQLRFVFLSWGDSTESFQELIRQSGMQDRFIVLPPVGKKKLIDYYRSCDIVLDQFVFGYYGATALEAASVGKPIIMKLRSEHYAPLYKGDVMPVFNADNVDEMEAHLCNLADSETLRVQRGSEMRAWLVRNHGEERTVPLMLALLRLTADRVKLPADLVSPLWDEESEEEARYHESCLQE